MIFDALGGLCLGEIPALYAGGHPAARSLGYYGRTKRLEDWDIRALGVPDPDFDIERAIALWLMMDEDDL